MATPGLEQLQPWVRERAEAAIRLFRIQTGARVIGGRLFGGVTPTITSGYRSIEKQAQLYANRASNPYPVNRPGDSAHEWGLAFDSSFAAKDKARYMPLWTMVREACGFRVPANDEVHAEVENWRNIVKARNEGWDVFTAAGQFLPGRRP